MRQDRLDAGWEALGRMEWAEAFACFETAVAHEPSAEALEGLGLAAWWLDDASTMFDARERACRLYRAEATAAPQVASRRCWASTTTNSAATRRSGAAGFAGRTG